MKPPFTSGQSPLSTPDKNEKQEMADPSTKSSVLSKDSFTISLATTDDAPGILKLFQKHLEYEGFGQFLNLTSDIVVKSIGSWSDPSKYFEVLAARNSSTSQLVGSCMFHKKFSFYRGRIIWMDQLFVEDNFQGMKIGSRMVQKLAEIAREDEACAIMWNCLERSTSSIEFYKSLGATVISEMIFVNPPIKALGFQLTQETFSGKNWMAEKSSPRAPHL